jgi:protein-S-isoprenylcysteine O-methyltransferase Ste14
MMRYLKAITSAVVTGLGTLQVAYSDNVVTQQEWIGCVIATLVALGAVWAVPNKPTSLADRRPPTT